MSNVATRLITLILTLQNQPNRKASELADKLGVSVRTLHRYFAMLDEMGIPVYAERGPYGGFSLVRGYKLPPLVFSMEEAVAVYLGTSLAGEMWGELYREASQGAMAKIENILPNEQRGEVDWARRSLVTTGLQRANLSSISPILEKLRFAARERRQVSALYQSQSTSKENKRNIDPYALVFRGGWWYLVGYCHLRSALRTFRVDRIQSLKVLEKSFEMPVGFDIHTYLENELKDQPVTRARLRFIPKAVHIVNSNPSLWESTQENHDGSVDVIMVAPDLQWLASFTLSFANWVKVLEPSELIVMVRDWAQSTADLYKT
ncbi:MAG: YafY family transcriptional regulator [Anaerolineales bacterium]|nr:YafY family transcriptional regulator [Anaerolineales bacterium]